MSDENLTDLLERAGDVVSVGPVPLLAVHNALARRRRQRAFIAVLASAAAVAAVIGGTIAVVPSANNSPDAAAKPPTRLFGLGHVAVEVPRSWPVNDIKCSAPQHDTIAFGGGGPSCVIPRPVNTEMITLERYDGEAQLSGSTKWIVDDHEVYAALKCLVNRSKGRVQCTARIVFAAEHVLVTLSSSTSRAKLLEMVNWIKVLPDRVAVPDPGVSIDPLSGLVYESLLENEGFRVKRVADYNGTGPTGLVTGVNPAPGTVLKPGSLVSFSVVSRRRNPDVKAVFTLRVHNPEDPTLTYPNHQILTGSTIKVALGGRLRLFIRGEQRLLVSADTDRAYLAPVPVGAFPRGVTGFAWMPVRVGRTTLTLYMVVNGEQVSVGKVILDVRTTS